MGSHDQMDMIGPKGESNDLPAVLRRYLMHELLQAGAKRANQHLAPPLGTPAAVVHDKVDGVPRVCIVHVDRLSVFNAARKAEGPVIPRSLAGG
jgi:hypothetical protein